MKQVLMIVTLLALAACAGTVSVTPHKDVLELEFIESEAGSGVNGAHWTLNDRAMDLCPSGYEVLNEKLVRLETRHVTWKIRCVGATHKAHCVERPRPSHDFVGPMPVDCE